MPRLSVLSLVGKVHVDVRLFRGWLHSFCHLRLVSTWCCYECLFCDSTQIAAVEGLGKEIVLGIWCGNGTLSRGAFSRFPALA